MRLLPEFNVSEEANLRIPNDIGSQLHSPDRFASLSPSQELRFGDEQPEDEEEGGAAKRQKTDLTDWSLPEPPALPSFKLNLALPTAMIGSHDVEPIALPPNASPIMGARSLTPGPSNAYTTQSSAQSSAISGQASFHSHPSTPNFSLPRYLSFPGQENGKDVDMGGQDGDGEDEYEDDIDAELKKMTPLPPPPPPAFNMLGSQLPSPTPEPLFPSVDADGVFARARALNASNSSLSPLPPLPNTPLSGTTLSRPESASSPAPLPPPPPLPITKKKRGRGRPKKTPSQTPAPPPLRPWLDASVFGSEPLPLFHKETGEPLVKLSTPCDRYKLAVVGCKSLSEKRQILYYQFYYAPECERHFLIGRTTPENPTLSSLRKENTDDCVYKSLTNIAKSSAHYKKFFTKWSQCFYVESYEYGGVTFKNVPFVDLMLRNKGPGFEADDRERIADLSARVKNTDNRHKQWSETKERKHLDQILPTTKKGVEEGIQWASVQDSCANPRMIQAALALGVSTSLSIPTSGPPPTSSLSLRVPLLSPQPLSAPPLPVPPHVAQLAALARSSGMGSQIGSQVGSQMSSQLGSQIGSQLGSEQVADMECDNFE